MRYEHSNGWVDRLARLNRRTIAILRFWAPGSIDDGNFRGVVKLLVKSQPCSISLYFKLAPLSLAGLSLQWYSYGFWKIEGWSIALEAFGDDQVEELAKPSWCPVQVSHGSQSSFTAAEVRPKASLKCLWASHNLQIRLIESIFNQRFDVCQCLLQNLDIDLDLVSHC